MRKHGVAVIAALLVLPISLAVYLAQPAESASSTTTDQTVGMPKAQINLAALSLGTGKSSTTPKVGYLDRCGGTPSGGPPVSIPPWVNTAAGTWNAKNKVAVEGNVTRTATFKATHTGTNLVVTGNGLPARSGTFPVAQSDPAFAYNPNPGSITSHSIKLTLPYNPKTIGTPKCEAGTVGIASNGIPILDGFDAGGNDAGGVETQDTCHGHPNNFVGYHYHSLSPCQLSTAALTHSTLVGWALDGFGIYVEYNSKGQLLDNSNLDVCHGRTSSVSWHGKTTRIYHYDMTFEFPYTVGCFRGTASSFMGMTITGAALNR
jgi:YHYH protein